MVKKNNNRSNQQKKQLCTCSTLFLYISLPLFFARLQRETSRNFSMEEMSYVFSFTFFSLIFSLHWWPLALSQPLQNFHVVLPKKNVSFVFHLSLYIFVTLFLVEFRWSAVFSLFLWLSLAVYSKFVDVTINLTLVLQKTRIQKQFPLSGFVFIDSLAASALQDVDGFAISCQNNFELHLGCHTC